MCECGCINGNTMFKFKGPDGGFYVLELLPGCDGCCHGPGVQIHHPEAVKFLDDVEYMEDLPIIGDGEHCITMVKCGLDPDEMTKAAIEHLTISEVDDNCIDESFAEILGSDLWSNALIGSPTVVATDFLDSMSGTYCVCGNEVTNRQKRNIHLCSVCIKKQLETKV